MSKITNFFKRKSLLRNIIVGILIVVTLGAAVGGVVALTRNTDKIDDALTYKTISSTSFSVGGLDSNGNYMSTDQSIYTKKVFECQGLNVTPDFDNTVSYQIYFYDQNNEFVHTTGKLTGAFVQDSVPFFAKYARIVITPNDDTKVTLFEVLKYAKQLEVKVYREQGFKNYSENLLEVDKTGYTLNTTSGAEEPSTDQVKCVSKWIQVSAYKESLVFRDGSVLASNGYVHFYDINKGYLGKITFGDWSSISFTSSAGVVYYNCEFSNLPFTGVAFMRFSYGTSSPFEVYCR